MVRQHVGGSFAPPLSDETLATYESMISQVDPATQERDVLNKVLTCVKQWWSLPESGPEGSTPHPVGIGTIVPLDSPIAEAIDPLLPWPNELKVWNDVLDSITATPLRNAAFHLLWHVVELNNGREPITTDKLPSKQSS